jgi:ferredoxin-NADP reductase
MNVNDQPSVALPVQNPARLPHGTTQDQVSEMESEGQATKQGQSPSPSPTGEGSTTPTFLLTLRRRETIAEHTGAFYFDKPSGFQFIAGQTVDLTLVNPRETDAEGDTRTFSIASSPEDTELAVATRLRDTAFKRVLNAMPIGSVLKAEGPTGSFTLEHDAGRPAVFLTGGIGITPFRSIIREAAAQNLTEPLWLFYSNTTPEAAAFLDELQQLADTTPSLHFVPTDMPKSARVWRGATGLIDREMLSSRLPIQGPRYYIAGPPAMVTAMRAMLQQAGVIDEDVRSEEFAGY